MYDDINIMLSNYCEITVNTIAKAHDINVGDVVLENSNEFCALVQGLTDYLVKILESNKED